MLGALRICKKVGYMLLNRKGVKNSASSSPSRDLNSGPADYKSAALPAKPLGHTLYRGRSAVKKVAPVLLTLPRHPPVDHRAAT